LLALAAEAEEEEEEEAIDASPLVVIHETHT
jgi:hypothetical protein